MPILGRVVVDPLRCRAPLVSLLQSKLGHSTTPSFSLSLSPLPASDLVSRESQKTRKLKMGGGELLGVRAYNQTDREDWFLGSLGVQWKIQLCRWKEHGEIDMPSKFQPNRTARSKDINISIVSVSGHWSDDLLRQQLSINKLSRSCHVTIEPTVGFLPRNLHR